MDLRQLLRVLLRARSYSVATAADAACVVVAMLLLLASALYATLLPAERAARVSPIEAIRAA